MSFVTLWIVVGMGRTAMVKRFCKKVIFEIRMCIMDIRWRTSLFYSSWQIYPPSFYYRYTPEEQKQIRERDFAEIRAMLEEFEENHGIKNEKVQKTMI